MIWIEHIGEMPPHLLERLTEESRAAFEKLSPETIKAVFDRSLRKWVVYMDGEPIIIAGVTYHTLLSANRELWALPMRGMLSRPLASAKVLRRLAESVYRRFPSVYVRVDPNNAEAVRFARFLRLRPGVVAHGYQVYERAS